ncbi:hypothetical protein ACJX0J_012302, partial [Zea mays]
MRVAKQKKRSAKKNTRKEASLQSIFLKVGYTTRSYCEHVLVIVIMFELLWANATTKRKPHMFTHSANPMGIVLTERSLGYREWLEKLIFMPIIHEYHDKPS